MTPETGGEVTPDPDTGGMAPEALPIDPQAVAALASRIKDATHLGDPDVTGWLFHSEANWSGSKYVSISQSYQHGSTAAPVLWYNEAGDLEVIGGPARTSPQQDNPAVWPFRVVRTDISDRNVEGITRSHGSIENHGLGVEWKGFEAIHTYEGGGTLTFRLFTDLEESDNAGNPAVGHPVDDASYPNVALTDPRIPAIPADQDGLHIGVPEGGLRGSLDGVAGTFTCSAGTHGYCGLEIGRHHLAPGYTTAPQWDSVRFTPDDGSAAVELPGSRPESVPAVNYVNFGYWLFVPEDVANGAFDFGMFAGGDAPFTVDNLQGLAGTAEYEGEAAGTYAETTMISSFSAKVALTADFGTADDFGAMVGRVYDFDIDGDKASPLTELNLQTASYRGGGTTNIFQRPWYIEYPIPGGWVEGDTTADGGWQGRWGGKFFGNDTAADLPTSFAGTFGATDGDRSFAGSFGTHQQ